MRTLKITKRISQKDGDTLDRYLKDINNIQLLTLEEEKELTTKAKTESAAMEKLVKANLRFVISVAKQYQNNGMPLEDLINEGNLGLMKAVYKFEPSKEIKFISYAVWWIRQTILQSLADNARMVRLPSNKLNDLYKVNRVISRLEQEMERDPSALEIAEKTKLEEDVIDTIMTSSARTISLDAPLNNEDGDTATLLDVLPSGETINIGDDKDLKKALDSILDDLSDREKYIIRRYYCLDDPTRNKATLEEIAIDLQITKERVRQIAESALRRIRNGAKTKTLKRYLHD